MTVHSRHRRRGHRRTVAALGLFATAAAATLVQASPAAAASYTCGSYRATIVGTKHADHIHGTSHRDVIYAGSGNDSIYGAGGEDLICGGSGNDRINGGSGADFLFGGSGRDTITVGHKDVGSGQAGNDTLTIVASRGYAAGGDGNDVLRGSRYSDRFFGGAGNDRIAAGAGNDVIEGGSGDDKLYGQSGTDRCDGNQGIDRCDGGSPGTAANTVSDPDLCDADSESHVSCHGLPLDYDVTASGTVHFGGLTETWSAAYSVSEQFSGYYVGTGTITWTVSGTDADGCSYAGGDTLAAYGHLSVYETLKKYAVDVYPSRERATTVSRTCPQTGTEDVDFTPLNTDAASSKTRTLPPDADELTGNRKYHPADEPAATVAWKWTYLAG